MYRVSGFVQHLAWALLGGCLAATLWVNFAPASYYDVIEWRLETDGGPLAYLRQTVTFRDVVADGLMALFVFYIGKELWEAIRLERGALRSAGGGVPVLGAAGGAFGAVAMWCAMSALFQTADEAGIFTGWPVPVGSDVALTYLFARAVFGPGSRAVHVLLLMTIMLDVLAVILNAVVNPGFELQIAWLLVPIASAMGVWMLFGRHIHRPGDERSHQRALVLWPYAVAGVLSWFGVAMAGLPPALGLLPILPAIPHADHAFGMFAEAEEYLTDPLNRIVHMLVRPLIGVMFLFGLTQGGIDLAAWNVTTAILLAAMWIGKPMGIVIAILLVARRLGFRLPQGMRRRDVGLIAGLAGIGFTAPALALDTGLPGGSMQEAARLGLAISLLAGPAAIILARLLRQRRRN